jgi:hypothetical protein
MKIRRRTVVVIVAAATIALLSPHILLFGTMAYQHAREYRHRERFGSKAWQDPKQVESEDPVRLRMVDDLIKSEQLDHLRRADVELLLGKPSTENYFKEYDLVYWLGPERGYISVDSEWLAIALDKDEVVCSYRIVRD